jgi:phage-related protein
MGGMFDRATMAAQDLAAAGFGTAESNAVALGKALNDPLKGVTALSRMGVTFTEEQKGMIESLMETGDVAGAQALIMKELETQVGGTAVAITTNSDKLDQSWSNLQETLGLALLPVVESFAGIVKPVADWFAQTPGAVGALIAVVATFTAVMAALAVVFIFVTIQTWAMNIALLANPITWIVLAVVAAVGLLIGIIILLVNNWEAVAKWFQDVFGPVFEWLGGIFNWLWEYAIKPVIDFVAAAFQWLWDYIIKPIIDFIVIYIMIWAAIITWLWEYVLAPVFGFIGEIFEWIWNYVIKPVVDFIVAYIEMMGMVFEWLYKNIIKPVFDSIAEVFNWIWKTIIKPVFDWIASAVNAVGKVFSDVFGAVASFIRDTFNNIVNFIKIPINAVIGFINMMIDGINSISIEVPDWINDLLGTNVQSIGFNIPKLPALAAGGYVDQPTMALIGEAGPEVVTPLKDFERMMGIGNGGGTVNYYAAPNESIDSEQALFDAMRRAKVVAGW